MSTTFLANQIRLNLVDLMNQAADPSAGGGVAAAIGSFLLRSGTGQAWLKTGAADTAWQKLVQSFAWYSVKDYGATGDNATDDTAGVQAAIDACATAGGGVVYFPPGTYRVSQLTINGQDNVQLCGAGDASIIRWQWNAAGAAGSMITLTNSDRVRIQLLTLTGAGLTNPDAGRGNHLLAIGNAGAAPIADTSVMFCKFTGMVANSGDGIHVVGAAGNLVERTWIKNNRFDGCSRYGIGIENGAQYLWAVQNYLTNCETEIALVASAAVANTGVQIVGNEILHTSATVRHALRLEGSAAAPTSGLVTAENIILGGFVTTTNVIYATLTNNVMTSGAFASADAAWRIFGSTTYLAFAGNTVVRSNGSSVGPCVSLERDAGASPSITRIGRNVLVNEQAAGNLITVVDCTRFSIGACICYTPAAGATNYGFDIQAVTVALTDCLIGPGNQFSTGGGTFAAAIRLLANGANVTDFSVVGNQGDNIDYGVRVEVGGGGGAFNGQAMIGTNNFDAATGDIQQVGVTIRPRIGFNAGSAGTVGPQCFQGTGSPEAVISARIGSIYLRTDGGQATTLYYKESGSGNTGWVAVGGWPIPFGANDLGTVATALYMAPGFIAAAVATEIQVAITRPGTIRNLRAQVQVAGTDVATVTFTVRKNGADTALVATIGNTATGAANDIVNSFTVVAGDTIGVKVTKSGAVTAGQQGVTATVECV